MSETSHTTDDNYLSSLKGAEWFVILSRGAFGFRYGPYSPTEVGEIMSQCVAEGIPALITGNCGREFDWDVARDFARGSPGEWHPMDDAPLDAGTLMGDVLHFETLMVWWPKWKVWRELNDDGSVGNPIAPMRWRYLREGDACWVEGQGDA